MTTKSGGEAILEIVQLGSILRVVAVDTVTGTEVSFQAPANTPRTALQQTALKKLAYVLNKQKN